MKSEIDATESVVYLANNGKAMKFPVPEFGTMKIGSNLKL
jgi:hypothetical protein